MASVVTNLNTTSTTDSKAVEISVSKPVQIPVLTKKKSKKPQARNAVVTFVRCQPPHKGHERVFDRMVDRAQLLNADPIVFPSVKQDPKNPLPFVEKVRFLQRMFPDVVISEHDGIKTPIDMLMALSLLKYQNVLIVVGSDRVADFMKFEKYVKQSGTKGVDIVLQTVVVDGVDRDSSMDGVEGLSGTKMKTWAREGDWDSFRRGLPTAATDALAKQLYTRLRGSMGLR